MKVEEDKNHFINRELSWIEFNRRVLSEARVDSMPLLERVKFLSILSSNFDEFFMVRVASVRRAIKNGDRSYSPNGESPSQTLKLIHKIYRETFKEQYTLWNNISEQLSHRGICNVTGEQLTQDQLVFLREFFQKELFNVLSPVKVEDNRPFPFTGNLRLNSAFLISPCSEPEETRMVVVEIPPYLSRLVWLPNIDQTVSFIFIEEVIALFVDQLFPGFAINGRVDFRISRDADIPVDEDKGEDFVEAMTKIIENRMHSKPMRLEVFGQQDELVTRLVRALDIEKDAVFAFPGTLSLRDLMGLSNIPGFDDLKYPVWEPRRTLKEDQDIWEWIRQEDRLLYQPYESFTPVVRLLSEAAVHPEVLSIRMTLYRTSGDSPIVQALAQAAQEGKQVTVLVELKARFDEEQNLGWAKTLEKAGCIVIYGVEGLKVHAKALLIVRREREGIRRYVHLGTGNYHDKTAKLYTDFGLFTAKEDFTFEVAQFFNAITGYSAVNKMRFLIMAPQYLKNKILSMIDALTRQASLGVPCRIMGKMNALADNDVIEALYRASSAGVEIKLNVRGICMLIPGAEFSKNIQIISIVDRYLEHGRAFVFRSGDVEDVYLSSADWMFRNLERRVELMFPVIQRNLKERIIETLKIFFADNTKSSFLNQEGVWQRRSPVENEVPIRAQEVFSIAARKEKELDDKAIKSDFVIIKKPKK